MPDIDFKYFHVKESLLVIIFSGVPSATIFPPFAPAPGPKSITQSAFFIKSRT